MRYIKPIECSSKSSGGLNIVPRKRQALIFMGVFMLVFFVTGIALAQSPEGQSGSLVLTRLTGMIQTTLIYGVFYSLLALGFALIFGAARVVNLYHGTFYMLGAYFFATFSNPEKFRFPAGWFWFLQIIVAVTFFYYLIKLFPARQGPEQGLPKRISSLVLIFFIGECPLLLLFFKAELPAVWNLNLFIGLVLAMGLISVMSIYLNRFIIEPVRDSNVAVLIITIALAFLTEKSLEAVYGSGAIRVPSFVQTKTINLLFGNTMDSKRLLMFFVGVILIAVVWILMTKTRIGKGVLAVAQDKEAATVMGVKSGFVFSFSISVSAVLAGIAGVFTTPFLGDAHPGIWLGPLIKSFAIVVIGGMGSIFGSVVGAFLLAFFEKLTKYYISSSLEQMVFLVVVIVILLIRPQGLFGKKGKI